MTTESQQPPPQQSTPDYPVRLSIDYVDEPRNRLTVFFRIITIIPITLVSSSITLLIWPVLLMMFFRQKYPRWFFDFNFELLKFSTRIGAHATLLTDNYPSTDSEQGIHLILDYPDTTQLNRWLPLIKWILAIPHYVVLSVLIVIAGVMVILGWLAILFTGRLPRGIHNFVEGVARWGVRVIAYSFLLTTDKYPPFSLD